MRTSAEKGRGFDPSVVEVMERRYVELETMVNAMETIESAWASLRRWKTAAPAAGFADRPSETEVRATPFLTSIISARQEAQLSLNWSKRSEIHELKEDAFGLPSVEGIIPHVRSFLCFARTAC